MSRSRRHGSATSRWRKIGVRDVFVDAPRWLFLGTLVYAPWAYGCTTAKTIVILDWLLSVVLVFWATGLLIRRERLPLPWPVFILLALGVIVGWALTLNAHAVYDPTFGIYVTIQSLFPNLPGSYDATLSVACMTRLTLLAGALCFVAQLSQRPLWLMRLWQTIAFAGASIALLGLLQKGTGAKMVFWQTWYEEVQYFFGPYYYHANAGAYLNLILPLTLGLMLRTISSERRPLERATWITAGVLAVIAVLANTSRMAQLLALLSVIVFAVWPARSFFRSSGRVNKMQLAAGLAIVVLVLVAVAQASQLEEPIKRWQTLGKTLTADARWPADATAWKALPDAGWLGLGPGVFRAIFPPYQLGASPALEGEWRFLHDDYLQAMLEWGRVAIVIFAFLFSGIGVAVWSLRHARGDWLPRQRAIIPLVVIALGSVAVHSAVDFPLQIASIQLYAATYLGICWGSARWGPRTNALVLTAELGR